MFLLLQFNVAVAVVIVVDVVVVVVVVVVLVGLIVGITMICGIPVDLMAHSSTNTNPRSSIEVEPNRLLLFLLLPSVFVLRVMACVWKVPEMPKVSQL